MLLADRTSNEYLTIFASRAGRILLVLKRFPWRCCLQVAPFETVSIMYRLVPLVPGHVLLPKVAVISDREQVSLTHCPGAPALPTHPPPLRHASSSIECSFLASFGARSFLRRKTLLKAPVPRCYFAKAYTPTESEKRSRGVFHRTRGIPYSSCNDCGPVTYLTVIF